MIVKPFSALRPQNKYVKECSALPYDVMSSEEARVEVVGKPYSFLHIDKAEIDLDTTVDLYSDAVYAKAAENLRAFEEKGVYVLDRTSNPGGADLQNRRMEEAEPLYITVARTIAAWHARHSGIGAVVGATNLKELEDIAAFFADKDIPMLIPGVGSQGGSAPEVMAKLRGAGYPIALARINSSSGITHPWKKAPAPADYAERALANLEKLIGETSL